jgi:hypothetical protein
MEYVRLFKTPRCLNHTGNARQEVVVPFPNLNRHGRCRSYQPETSCYAVQDNHHLRLAAVGASLPKPIPLTWGRGQRRSDRTIEGSPFG